MSINTLGEECSSTSEEVPKAASSASMVVLAEHTPLKIRCVFHLHNYTQIKELYFSHLHWIQHSASNFSLLKSFLEGSNFRDHAVPEVKLQV